MTERAARRGASVGREGDVGKERAAPIVRGRATEADPEPGGQPAEPVEDPNFVVLDVEIRDAKTQERLTRADVLVQWENGARGMYALDGEQLRVPRGEADVAQVGVDVRGYWRKWQAVSPAGGVLAAVHRKLPPNVVARVMWDDGAPVTRTLTFRLHDNIDATVEPFAPGLYRFGVRAGTHFIKLHSPVLFAPPCIEKLEIAAGAVREIGFELPRGGRLVVRGGQGTVSVSGEGGNMAVLRQKPGDVSLPVVRTGDYVVSVGDWTKNVTVEPGVETTVWVGD